MNNKLSEWDYKPLWVCHAAEMAAAGNLKTYADFIHAHHEALENCFDEACFLHYQGLFYPYRDKQIFLNTLYWRWIREYVKFREFGREVLDTRWNNINVHHTTYAVCGREHQYLHTLQVLGREQHDNHHRMNRYADYGTPPLLQRSSSPGSLPCSWHKEHPRKCPPARWVFNEPDTALEDISASDRIWLICNDCYEIVTRKPIFEFSNPPSAPKLIRWEESEDNIFTDLDACEGKDFGHIIRRCEYEQKTGGFHLYDNLNQMLKP